MFGSKQIDLLNELLHGGKSLSEVLDVLSRTDFEYQNKCDQIDDMLNGFIDRFYILHDYDINTSHCERDLTQYCSREITVLNGLLQQIDQHVIIVRGPDYQYESSKKIYMGDSTGTSYIYISNVAQEIYRDQLYGCDFDKVCRLASRHNAGKLIPTNLYHVYGYHTYIRHGDCVILSNIVIIDRTLVNWLETMDIYFH